MISDFPYCPHCAHVERDALEIDFGHGLDGSAVVTCNQCGKDYFCERIVAVSYKTEKLNADTTL